MTDRDLTFERRESTHRVMLRYCVVSVPERHVVHDVDFAEGERSVALYLWESVKRDGDVMTFPSSDTARQVLSRIEEEPGALWTEWRDRQWTEVTEGKRPTLAVAKVYFEVWYEVAEGE